MCATLFVYDAKVYPFAGMRGSSCGSSPSSNNSAAETLRKYLGEGILAAYREVDDMDGLDVNRIPSFGRDGAVGEAGAAGAAGTARADSFGHGRERSGSRGYQATIDANVLLRLGIRCYRGALQALGREHARDASDVEDKR